MDAMKGPWIPFGLISLTILLGVLMAGWAWLLVRIEEVFHIPTPFGMFISLWIVTFLYGITASIGRRKP
jgi:hypothetical protein